MHDDMHHQLSRYLDGELPPEDARTVAQKIRDDATWRAAWQDLKNFDALARETYPRTQFTPPLHAARPRRRVALAAAVAAALALFVGLGYAALRATTPSPEEPISQAQAAHSNTGESVSVDTPAKTDVPDSTALSEASNEPAPASGPTWSGAIKNADGEPIVDARALLTRWQSKWGDRGHITLVEARTDGAGRFSFATPDLRMGDQFFVAARDYKTEVFKVTAIRDAALEWEITMQPSYRAQGRVVDEAGNPVSGAELYAGWRSSLSFTASRTFTDDDGRFDVVAEDPEGSGLEIRHPDFAYARVSVISSRDNEATLVKAGALRVRLLKGGAPVKGKIALVVGDRRFMPDFDPRAVGDTGETTFTNLRPGAYSAFGFTELGDLAHPVAKEVKIAAGEVGDLALEAPERYPGRAVIHVDFPPHVPRPALAYFAEELWPDRARPIPVPAEGPITVPLSYGRTSFHMVVNGFLLRDDFNVTSDGEILPRYLSAATSQAKSTEWLRVRLIDAAGEPVQRALVSMSSMNCLPSISKLFVLPTADTFEAPRDGLWTIGAWDPATERGTMFRTEEPITDPELTLVLDEPTRFFEGFVQDANGAPIANAFVRAIERGTGSTTLHQPFGFASALTDSTGFFRAGPIDAGAAPTLWAYVAGHQPTYDVAISEPSTTITLAPLHLLVGKAIDATGAPVYNARIYINQAGSETDAIRTDDQGLFAGDLPAGSYQLQGVVEATFGGDSVHVDTEPEPGVETGGRLRILYETERITLSLPRTDDTTVELRFPVSLADAPLDGDEHEARANNLKQLGLSLKMFANEAKDELLPKLATTFGVFAPDMDEIYPEYVPDIRLLDPFRQNAARPYAYSGYALQSEESGLAFLDAYEQLGPEAISGNDIEVGGDILYQLREDIHEYVDTGGAGRNIQSEIPVIWEMPNEGETEAWVLYMDGHAERLPYPSDRFPMTEAFIERLRGLMRPAP